MSDVLGEGIKVEVAEVEIEGVALIVMEAVAEGSGELDGM